MKEELHFEMHHRHCLLDDSDIICIINEETEMRENYMFLSRNAFHVEHTHYVNNVNNVNKKQERLLRNFSNYYLTLTSLRSIIVRAIIY